MIRRAAFVLALALLVGACGGGDDEPAAGSGVVGVQNSSFSPPSVSVKVGQKVTWTFRDSFDHTATADDGSFDSGAKSADATFDHTFTTAGTFAYKCAIHPSMRGTVVVAAA